MQELAALLARFHAVAQDHAETVGGFLRKVEHPRQTLAPAVAERDLLFHEHYRAGANGSRPLVRMRHQTQSVAPTVMKLSATLNAGQCQEFQ